MINDPSVAAILQARRNFNARDPNSIKKIDPLQIDPPEPGGGPNQVPVQPPPQVSPQDRAVARQAAMQGYMQRFGLQPMQYGANNVRTGNLSLGSDGAGYVPTPATPPVAGTLRGPNAPPLPGPNNAGPTDPSTAAGKRFGAI